MAVYAVVYDLTAPGRNYDELYKTLRSYGNYARPTESTWLLETSETPSQIRDKLKKVVDYNDVILVMTLSTGAAGLNIKKEVWEWIERRL